MTPVTFDPWIELSLKGTIVLFAAVATCWTMWRASAASRHLVWAAAVSALLVLPALSVVVPDLTVPVSFTALATTSPVLVPLPPDMVATDRPLNASRREHPAASGMAAPQRPKSCSRCGRSVRCFFSFASSCPSSAPVGSSGRPKRSTTSGGTRSWRRLRRSSASHVHRCCCGRLRFRCR